MRSLSAAGIILLVVLLFAQYIKYMSSGCNEQLIAMERDLTSLGGEELTLGSVSEKIQCNFYRQAAARLQRNISRWQQCGQTRSSVKEIATYQRKTMTYENFLASHCAEL
jgi:hypothetical protein